MNEEQPQSTPPMAAGSSSIIDWQVILAYLEGFKPEYRAEELEHLIDLFTRHTPELLDNLHAAITAADLELVRRYAHNLVANSGTVGARNMSQTARYLEHQAMAGTLAEAPALLTRLQQMYTDAATTLPAWRSAIHLAP